APEKSSGDPRVELAVGTAHKIEEPHRGRRMAAGPGRSKFLVRFRMASRGEIEKQCGAFAWTQGPPLLHASRESDGFSSQASRRRFRRYPDRRRGRVDVGGTGVRGKRRPRI